jgi:hypothetical protein
MPPPGQNTTLDGQSEAVQSGGKVYDKMRSAQLLDGENSGAVSIHRGQGARGFNPT